MARQVSGTIAATGEGTSLAGKVVDVSISGTWVGTVDVQRAMGATWNTIESYTGNAEVVVENATKVPVRVYFTRTSGSVDYLLQA
jgi:hypothetical protein